MRLRTYIMLVSLICILCLCTVHEALRQTQARYKIGQLLQKEEAMGYELSQLKTRAAELSAAPRLEDLATKLSLDEKKPVVPLEPVFELAVEDILVLE